MQSVLMLIQYFTLLIELPVSVLPSDCFSIALQDVCHSQQKSVFIKISNALLNTFTLLYPLS